MVTPFGTTIVKVNGSPLHAEQPDEQPKHQTPAERALSVGCNRERLPTGIKSLDDATRGGLPTGKIVVTIGPPGALKTGFASWLAITYARAGYAVSVLAADESGESFLIRWGQAHGIDRDALESGEEGARADLARELAALPTLDLWDADVDDTATIESVSTHLAARRNDRPSVLILDSLQSIARVLPSTEDTRGKVDAVLGQVKVAARADGHLVLATSEAGRGSYASRNRAMRSDPLAAGKESGGIEYGGDLQLVFSSVKDAPGFSDVEVPKNRLGRRRDFVFRLEMSFKTTDFAEVAIDEEDDSDERDRARLATAEKRVLAYVFAHPGASGRMVERSGGNLADNGAALDALVSARRVEKRAKPGRGGGFEYHAIASARTARESSDA